MLLIVCLSMCLCLGVYAQMTGHMTEESREDTRSSEVEVRNSCEPPDVGGRSQTGVLCTINGQAILPALYLLF